MKKSIILILMLVLLLPAAFAKQGHLPLLAVKETSNGYVGSLADVSLEIMPGTGRVYIETFPLSKMDTQISTRMAKEIACQNLDCSKYDFFYNINSDAVIVGGPSAGGAIAVLTAVLLNDFPLNETIAMTGTINSGGLIGPVSGLKAKIDAAASANLTTVLIPFGELVDKEDNVTTDLKAYGAKKGINVIEVTDLSEALFYFTGIPEEKAPELLENANFSLIMKGISEKLCQRTVSLQNISIRKETKDLILQAKNLSDKGEAAYNQTHFYTAASFCFGANVLLRQASYLLKNSSFPDLTRTEISEVQNILEGKKIATISDLETYMIVKDRLQEAENYLDNSNSSNYPQFLKDNAKASERVFSARSWEAFFALKGKEYILDNETLKAGCLNKLGEAEERYQYANLFFPGNFEETKKGINAANAEFEKNNYELCLFGASKSKAEVDVVLSTIGVEDSQVDSFLDNKLKIAKRVIAEEQIKGVFPILGYSYYEYSNSLRAEDKYSALVYAEYALELSNLDVYFKQTPQELPPQPVDNNQLIGLSMVFFSGIMVGIIITLLYKRFRNHSRK